MANQKKTVVEEDYRKENGNLCPILDLFLGKDKKRISAYVDTGCSTGIFVFKEQIQGIDIGTKINDDPSKCIAADGDIVAADEYACMVSINGEDEIVIVTVVDPNKRIGHENPEKMTPLLGRGFLDNYDALFKGRDKRITLFK